MRHSVIVSLAATAAVTLLSLLLSVSANATVLISVPSSTITLGQRIESGVWYQSYSGGPRWARITILTPNKRVVWSHRVTASASRWKDYRYRPKRTGTYVLRYKTAEGTVSFRVRVRD